MTPTLECNFQPHRDSSCEVSLIGSLVAKIEIEKPWTKERRSVWPTVIPCFGFACGLALIAVMVYLGVKSVPRHEYCLVMEDGFDGPTLNTSIWQYEVQLGGFGNGEFEVTTNDTANVFLDDGKLVIKPTLQNTNIIDTPYALVNLTADGTCTSDVWSDCWASTNSTNHTIINPIRSGRINTKASASIRYGRVEVVAKMPTGDWLWPAIWLLPVNDVYGPWPASGEIDIVESRGNDHNYKYGGNNKIVSSLHWGPTKALDQSWRDTNTQRSLHSSYSAKFHTYALEWSEKYLYTYVDSRIHHVIYTKYTKPQWTRGQFPQFSGGELTSDPWNTNRFNTPFDTPFYLIINLAVGGTNGFFQDPDSQKPWVNTAVNASAYFWGARDSWLPTWVEGQAQLEVESVKMWQECG
ncbi:glycoside hydrolase family 16 protein [Cadophora sp. DSE1049]|nr:glycoside hydrolase family 16 protein [Cadophora sp. DSE1049]